MQKKWMRMLDCFIFPIILLLYPLRHIRWGLDLWDTGYNYGNFQFMGTEHMDPMWLFSTYLANVTGSLLTKLPFGDTLMGMNFYTGLFVSVLALMGYWFCKKKLGIPFYLVFLGEITAVSLCWCPTALLYNYLTYIFFLTGSCLLYLGLKNDTNGLLAAAGVCLGTNVLVRFSNLPEAAMIIAVWAYAVICRDKLKKTIQRTGWCLLGYLGALAVWLLVISLRYGFGAYVEGIQRLFGMTETATDYSAYSMLLGMVWSYIENLYWVIRLGAVAIAGLICFAILPAGWNRLKKLCIAVLCVLAALWMCRGELGNPQFDGYYFVLRLGILVFMTAAALQPDRALKAKKLCFAGMLVCTVLWMYEREFCSLHFYEYNSMLRPGILFLMMAISIGLIQVFRLGVAKEEKLLSGMVVLIVLLTSLGSNNGIFPSLNNLFLAGPYVFWMIWKFVKYVPVEKHFSFGRFRVSAFFYPVKAMAVLLLAMLLFQGIGFGAGFVFVEAAGARNVDTQVRNNRVLQGIYMSEERAVWMEEISTYVNENGLEGKEVILYGRIPSLAYYLNMPPAFNSWCDLASYSLEAMAEAMEELKAEIAAGKEPPVVILEKNFYEDEEKTSPDRKLALIEAFMESNDYELTFSNDKFLIYESE